MKVIYTAHGFHFFSGASFLNWCIYYPIEYFMSQITDCLITINDEDYQTALKSLKAQRVHLIPGVGIDVSKFYPTSSEEKKKLRLEYDFDNEDFILLYAGELSHRKNQLFLLDVASSVRDRIPGFKLLLAGTGVLRHQLEQRIIELGLEKNVYLLGYRKDVANLMRLSNAIISSSKQEGLPLNLLEAMATGLPIVASNCRGNRDLVENKKNGYLCDIGNTNHFVESIVNLYEAKDLNEFSTYTLKKVKLFTVDVVQSEMRKIYCRFL